MSSVESADPVNAVVRKITAVALLLFVLSLVACWQPDFGQQSESSKAAVPSVSRTESEETVDEQAERYQAAADLEELGNYEDAARVFASLGTYLDAAERSAACLERQKEADYAEACSLYGQKRYAEAASYFEYLKDYRDSESYLDGCRRGESRERLWNLFAQTDIGGTLSFGRMEQDGRSGNGAEELEWIIVSKADDRLLVMSKTVLTVSALFDRLPQPDTEDPADWNGSLPCEWLNGPFLEEAFTEAEREMMPGVEILPDGSSAPVFRLLTPSEAEALPQEVLRSAAEDGLEPGESWWLMPDPDQQGYAYIIGPDGICGTEPEKGTEKAGVRPVFWIGH